MTIEELKRRKIEKGYSNEKLAELSGVPLGTVQKLMGGITRRPRYATLQALERILGDTEGMPAEAGRPAQPYGNAEQSADAAEKLCGADRVQETASGYFVPEKKRYTVADYMALPEDQRVELIDGEFYDMAAPRSEHQFMIGEVYAEFLAFVKRKKGKCLPFVSPIDVQLDSDEYTMVQPDVVILCDRGKIRNGRIVGAPDLVVEVLSPGTSRKDRTLKLSKYTNAGVREYWMIDLRQRKILVYWLQEDEENPRDYARIYSFRDRVPVGIWKDECVVDFAEIDDFYTEVYGSGTD